MANFNIPRCFALSAALAASACMGAVLGSSSPNQIQSHKDAKLLGHVDRWISHRDSESESIPDKNLGNEVLYQVFIDRFANGNSANDCLDGDRFCDRSRHDWYKFWGGDLRGVINQLPYLKNLGVTRLWLTPIVDNQMVTVERERYGADVEVTPYHGYWVRDWFRLNPYFTDAGKEDFAIVDELIAKAQPEIKLYLDTVANHTSPADATTWSLDRLAEQEPLDQSQGLRTHRGALFREGAFVGSMETPGLFHPYGPIENYEDREQVENYQLDGLADLDQNSALVRSYMRDAHSFWIQRFPGLAGYRMDTIKHVPQSYWRAFDQEFFAAHPTAEVVGEYYGAGPYNAGSRQFYRETRMSMFDFDFRHAIDAVFRRGASMEVFSRLWERDGELGDARPLVTFIDNHDVARLRGMPTPMSAQAMRQAVVLLFMARGVPCIYYGLEQDLFYDGDPGDPYNRPMMTSFDQQAPFYKDIQSLAGLRKANKALRYGSTHIVHETRHILAFERDFEGQKAFFATSTNPISGSDTFDIQNLTLADGAYRDLLSGKVYQVKGGRMPVSLGKGDVIVLSTTDLVAQ